MRFKLSLSALLLCLTLCGTALAQTSKGTIAGIVRDPFRGGRI